MIILYKKYNKFILVGIFIFFIVLFALFNLFSIKFKIEEAGKINNFSIDQEEILKNIKLALDFGAKEVQLTSQDLAIYGLDKGEFKLPKLLKKISEIKGK